MYELVYQGVDTLDVAVKGAAPDAVLADLKSTREQAEADHNNEHGLPVRIGPDERRFFIKAHGKKGGYRYTAVDERTGTIISIKDERRSQMWNIFVSCRAHSLLCLGYTGMKHEVDACLSALGVVPQEYSVNRIDYALDFLAPDFVLDMAHFVAPGTSKVSPYYDTGHHLNDHGDTLLRDADAGPVGSVMRGGRFESVTVGKMPGRQVMVYDKTGAAKAQRTPYWFPVWGIDPDDTGRRVWRVEIRCARDSWKRVLGQTGRRNYETVEALLPRVLRTAVAEIRYVIDRQDVSNVTRSELHPLWQAATDAVADLPDEAEPPLTPEYVLDLMRREREAMALAQGFGNVNNLLILKGHSQEEIICHYPQLAAQQAREYVRAIGEDGHRKKLSASQERNAVWLHAEGLDMTMAKE